MSTEASPDNAKYGQAHALLDSCVRGQLRDWSVEALRGYFALDTNGRPFYTGSGFERFDGGGDTPASQDQITSSDVLSLTFLQINRGLARVITEAKTVYADEIAALLAAIPADRAMHEVPWSTYANGSPAARLFDLLCKCGGKNRSVTASKLLARKRPHLLPVYDSKVKKVLGGPQNMWECLWTWFTDDDTRHPALEELRDETGGINDISLLRCLDIVLWRRGTDATAIQATKRRTAL